MGTDFQPQLALVFVSQGYGQQADSVVARLRERLPSLQCIFGCSAYGVLGSMQAGPEEVEGEAALSISLGELPGVVLSARHTLRSAIPSEDAAPEEWARFVGLPANSSRPTSFLILADPKFQQLRDVLAGLDFAFPAAAKLGGVVSSGQRFKRRTMYAWSAPSPAAAAAAGASMAAAPQRLGQLQQQQQEQKEQQRAGGLLRGLFGKAIRSLGEKVDAWLGDAEDGQPSTSGDDEGEADSGYSTTGVHMYGAVILALQGSVTLDTLTCQGYRTVDDAVWVVEDVARDGTAILSISSSQARDESGNSGGARAALSSGKFAVGRSGANDSDDDSDDDEAANGGLATPLLAVYSLLEALHERSGAEMSDAEMQALSEKLAVAVASDSLKRDADLQPDDFQVMAVTDIDDNFGALMLDGEVRTGYRMKLVLRDREGIEADLRQRLLASKKADLGAILAGGPPQAAPIGGLVFTDIGRGLELYGESGVESALVGRYLPVPLSGMFGAAEISTVNRKASIYELTTAIGVMRAVAPHMPDEAPTDAAASAADNAATAAGEAQAELQQLPQQKQPQQQQQESRSSQRADEAPS